jgi:hypothetical protein
MKSFPVDIRRSALMIGGMPGAAQVDPRRLEPGNRALLASD